MSDLEEMLDYFRKEKRELKEDMYKTREHMVAAREEKIRDLQKAIRPDLQELVDLVSDMSAELDLTIQLCQCGSFAQNATRVACGEFQQMTGYSADYGTPSTSYAYAEVESERIVENILSGDQTIYRSLVDAKAEYADAYSEVLFDEAIDYLIDFFQKVYRLD